MQKTVSVAEAADILGVDRATIWRWLKSPQNPFPGAYRLNPDQPRSPYRIPRSDIEAFDRRRREEGVEPGKTQPADSHIRAAA